MNALTVIQSRLAIDPRVGSAGTDQGRWAKAVFVRDHLIDWKMGIRRKSNLLAVLGRLGLGVALPRSKVDRARK